MKNVLLLAVFSLFCLAAKAQIKVNSTGKVGINNTSPTYQLDVSGTFRVNDSGNALLFQNSMFYPSSGYASLGSYSYMWDEVYAYQGYFYYCDIYYSDINLKTDIKNLNSASSRLKALRPVSYKMKPHVRPGNEVDVDVNAEQMGFVAQEMKDIFPEIVVEDKNGLLGIRYTELIPILVKAFQEQQQVIEELKAKVDELQATKN